MKKSLEDHITSYLKKKYNPDAIVLMGSRARGTAHKTSDWDICIYTDKDFRGGFFYYKDQGLDITFKPLPRDSWLTIHYGPIHPFKILLDNTNGVLIDILKRTRDAYQKGPLKLYKSGCKDRLDKTRRLLDKIKHYEKQRDIQFYYAGIFYEFAIRVWFEQQNLWPLPPAEALPHFKKSDLTYWKLLNTFISSKSKKCTHTADLMLKRIESLRITH